MEKKKQDQTLTHETLYTVYTSATYTHPDLLYTVHTCAICTHTVLVLLYIKSTIMLKVQQAYFISETRKCVKRNKCFSIPLHINYPF